MRKKVTGWTKAEQNPLFQRLDGEGDFIFDMNQSATDKYVSANATPAVVDTVSDVSAEEAVAPAKTDKEAKKPKKAKKATN